MSITRLGLPHRIVYASKNFTSGLVDVQIKILKPNGLVHQTGIMSEMSVAGFEGIYEFIMNTGSTDPEGEYIVSIVSSSESYKAKTKVTVLSSIGGGSSSENDVSDIDITLDISFPSLKMDLSTNETQLNLITNKLEIDVSSNSIKMEIANNKTDLNIENNLIKLDLDCA